MKIIDEIQLKSNRKIKLNFDGGDLSSDTGLFLPSEFAARIGFEKVAAGIFSTGKAAANQLHGDGKILMQEVFQTIAGYFRDDHADEMRPDPVFNEILGKKLASQPTMSRFFNRTSEDTLMQLESIHGKMRENIYGIKPPEMVLFDLDSTLFETYGKQEGNGFNYHYKSRGYHPLFCFDGLTRDLLKVELRDGPTYTSNGAAVFMKPLLDEYMECHPSVPVFLRGDSGFASPELYGMLECNGCSYAIRLKVNNTLMQLAKSIGDELFEKTKKNQVDHAAVYGEFYYQAGSWDYPRRVAVKVEKPDNQMTHLYTFIVTNMGLPPESIVKFYCNRGAMENFIKEAKNGFDFGAMGSNSKIVNANRLQISMLAYNLFNWFRRLVLPEKMRNLLVDTIRIKLFKISSRLVRGAGYLTYKLCSSCPYKGQFAETLENIWKLRPA
jgi:hypothetical protein